VFINIADAARLMRYPTHHATGWQLSLKDPFDIEQVIKPLTHQFHISDWRDQEGEFFQSVKMERYMMAIMLGLIIAVAAFNIISALSMVVMEKESEVAILQTQGMTRQRIMNIFIIQGASSGIIGAIVGAILGILLTQNINNLFHILGINLLSNQSLPTLLTFSNVSSILFLAIVLSILATLYPAYKASSIQPAEALRYE